MEHTKDAGFENMTRETARDLEELVGNNTIKLGFTFPLLVRDQTTTSKKLNLASIFIHSFLSVNNRKRPRSYSKSLPVNRLYSNGN